MILPPILEDIVILDSIVSVIYGLGLLIFLTMRRQRKDTDEQSDTIDALAIRIFIWLQLIFGSSIIGGVMIEKLSHHTHLFPLMGS